ncbi:MAG: transposase, partial [Candidatus Subteraquimicrobiales bacterium]|nr:transposase [Candidatus Subteraquimicrobiales bacterium]
MPRGTIHQPCPCCQGTNTKRHDILVLKRITLQGVQPKGVQRWFCKDCGKPFTPKRPEAELQHYNLAVHEKAVMLYFDQGASYRAVAREFYRLGLKSVDAMRTWKLVQTMASNSKTPWQVSLELKPQWCGYIVVDGDSLKVGNHRESALLGVDIETLDIPHLILAEHEDIENWLFFFLVLKYTVGYPFKGIVSDGDPAIEEAIRLVCPGTPHQFCVKHFQDGLHRYLRYQSSHGRGTWREVQRFEDAVRRCLYTTTLEEARKYLLAIQIDPGFRKIHLEDGIRMLERNFERLAQHFLHPGLPRTSNVAEGLIRKLDRRLNAMDSFGSHETAWSTLKMLTIHTRFRNLTDCRKPNGH